MKHAIPLDERAIGALSHSALVLNVYSWLLQRLHRIPYGEKQFVPWQQLKEQFGQGYGRMDHFKTAFRSTLKAVLLQYLDARNSIEEIDNKGGLDRCLYTYWTQAAAMLHRLPAYPN